METLTNTLQSPRTFCRLSIWRHSRFWDGAKEGGQQSMWPDRAKPWSAKQFWFPLALKWIFVAIWPLKVHASEKKSFSKVNIYFSEGMRNTTQWLPTAKAPYLEHYSEEFLKEQWAALCDVVSRWSLEKYMGKVETYEGFKINLSLSFLKIMT